MSMLRSSGDTVLLNDKHEVAIYRNDEYASNWPFTGGMYRYDDGEIAVGFTRLKCDEPGKKQVNHMHLDTWGELCIVRSYDDGETWDMDNVEVVVDKRELSIEFFQKLGQAQVSLSCLAGSMNSEINPIDFNHPDFMLLGNYIGEHMWCEGYDVRFWTMVLGSEDRGRTWKLGPLVKKPRHFYCSWGTPSYVLRPDGSLLLFSDFIAKDRQRWPCQGIYADIMEEGGLRWHFHGILDLDNRDARSYIHPAPVSLGDGVVLLAARCQQEENTVITMLYRSEDWGRNWRTLGRVADLGGTPHLLRLNDGRLVLTYERRRPPCGMRARISEDTEGYRWGPEIILRDDGAGGDLGYSRNVQRADGKVLTAYYFNKAGEAPTQAECVRHIAGTIWDPDNI